MGKKIKRVPIDIIIQFETLFPNHPLLVRAVREGDHEEVIRQTTQMFDNEKDTVLRECLDDATEAWWDLYYERFPRERKKRGK
ncbi:MAG TPA: hypothetical protein VEB18_03145 [Candidatus Paceibacterota bacterium]|nr:hypothetical protein [Candidatus Paceibacterota bacterium]